MYYLAKFIDLFKAVYLKLINIIAITVEGISRSDTNDEVKQMIRSDLLDAETKHEIEQSIEALLKALDTDRKLIKKLYE